MARTTLIFALAVSVSACALLPAKKSQVGISEKIPATRAQLSFAKTDNDNTKIDLKVNHLAEPERVVPGATTYIVWVRPTGDAPAQNLGALKVDRNLKAKLETVTPQKNFELFVTAESSPLVTNPSGEALMWTTVRR